MQPDFVVLLLPPPQAGRRNKAVITTPTIRTPSSFLRNERAELNFIPARESPAIGSHIA